MNIGFLGLGIMGSRMAANLIKAGNKLTVWNRSADRANPLVEMGATHAATAAEAARGKDVVITMLAKPSVVEEVALGPEGFLAAMQPGAIWMDCSTVNPSFSRKMGEAAHQRQIHFVDAPVAGTKEPAANAQLLFLVGGDAADVEKVRPLTDKMGRAMHAGDVGMGASLKMLFNLLLGQSLLAFAETLVLGEAMGFPRDRLFEIFTGSAVVAPSAIAKRAKIEEGSYEPDFPLQWLQKDLELVSTTAYENGLALPSANVAKAVYMLAARYGFAEKDMAAIYPFLKETKTAE